MQQKFSQVLDGFSLLARMFCLALWTVTQASFLARQIGIPACFGTPGTRRLGSLRDNSGWKPKLLRG